jgi:arylsulfatase A-like enzyme
MDAVAQAGVRFADVTAPSPTTLASHASMMTGSWPQTHGVVRNGFTVNPANVMLAELLSERGFHTAGFLGSFALDSRFGFDQGFDHFDEAFDILVSPKDGDQNQRRADRVTDAVLGHVDELAGEDERLFLFVHYFDPHAPYAPPNRGDADAATHRDLEHAVRTHQALLVDPPPGMMGVITGGLDPRLVQGADGQPLPGDEYLADLYAGEVAFVDAQIGRLLAGLDKRGILDDALVVITGDHGETFWEHGDFWNHGLWVYQTTLSIPLILRFPREREGASNVWPSGMVITEPVSTIDLVPTLCELLGIPVPDRVDGTSLVGLMKGKPLAPRPLYCQATQPGWRIEPKVGWANLHKPRCIREGPLKYVHAPYLQLEQLFDLSLDPGERVNLLAGPNPNPRAVAQARRMRVRMDGWIDSARPFASSRDGSQDREVLERLRALGYAGDD